MYSRTPHATYGMWRSHFFSLTQADRACLQSDGRCRDRKPNAWRDHRASQRAYESPSNLYYPDSDGSPHSGAPADAPSHHNALRLSWRDTRRWRTIIKSGS